MPRLLALLTLTAFLATAARAQAPREIPYHGTLADGGAPVTSATPVVFRLHDAASGGEIVWAESQTVTPDADGRFTARLGSVADLPGIDQPLWLSVTAAGAVLGPRTALGAAPYALALYGVRVEPATTEGYAPAIAAGHPSNQAGEGAVVAGGGAEVQFVNPNRAMGQFAVVSGGRSNEASGNGATIGGGSSNEASGDNTTIGGGADNTASVDGATIGGGSANQASGPGATVAGGENNQATGSYAAAGGGYGNVASGFVATIGGGLGNLASGESATIPGGELNSVAGDYSFAAGSRTIVAHTGTFAWGDRSTATDFLSSTGDNQFLIRAAGGVGIGTNAPDAQLHVEADAQHAGQFENDGEGFAGATVYAENASTGNGIAGWFETNGTEAPIVAYQRGSGDVIRAIVSQNLRFRVQNNGDVTADGSFTGGGADLAEFFPLADGAAVAPGQVVGLRGGRVSLSTDGAEQIAVISSNPAFIGNPDAEAGGALVALVGQVQVHVSGDAAAGDLLIASGRSDGRARAVSPSVYAPADGAVLGRVLSADGGRVVALVGVDETAALRGVVARQADAIQALRADRDRQQAQIDALTEAMTALEARLAL